MSIPLIVSGKCGPVSLLPQRIIHLERDNPQPLYLKRVNSNLKSIEQPEPDKGCLIAFLIFMGGFVWGCISAYLYLT